MANNTIYKNKTKRIISFSIMALIVLMGIFLVSPSDVAYAQESFDFIDSSDVQLDDDDKSKELFFNPIFGNVDDFSFQDSPIAGVVMAFNAAVLFIAGILAAYTMMAGTVNTAHDGELLGQRWSSSWMPIRTAMGAASLLPVFQGFCFAQVLVIWLAMQGSGLANYTWNKYTENIEDSVSFVSVYQTTEMNKAVYNMFLSNVCTYSLIKASNLPGASNVVNPLPKYDVQVLQDFNNSNSHINLRYGVDKNKIVKGDATYGNPVCGSYTMDLANANNPNNDGGVSLSDRAKNLSGYSTLVGTIGDNNTLQYLNSSDISGFSSELSEVQRKSVIIMQNELSALARDFVFDTGESTLGPDRSPARPVYNIVTKYNNTIKQEVDRIFSDTSFLAGFKENIKKDGWLFAGSWYIKIVQMQKAINGMASTVPVQSGPMTTNIDGFGDEVRKNIEAALVFSQANRSGTDIQSNSNAGGSIEIDENTSVSPGNQTQGDGSWFSFMGDLVSSGASRVKDIVAGGGDRLVAGYQIVTGEVSIANLIQNKINSTTSSAVEWFVVNVGQATNPVLVAQSLGSFVISSGWAILGITLALGMASSGAAFAGVGLAASLFTVGAGLEVVLPMTPFVIWMSVVLSWMVLVCQAVIGAPLWAVAHMHPDADGIVGKAGQGYMLILGLTIKPALMIVGLVLALTLILPFGYFFNSIFVSAFKFSQSSRIGIISFIAIIFLYWSLMMMIIKKTFSLIYSVPDQILQWLGAGLPQLGQGAEQMQQQAKQELSGAMDKAQGAAGQAGQAVGGAYMGGQRRKLAEAGMQRSGEQASAQQARGQSELSSAKQSWAASKAASAAGDQQGASRHAMAAETNLRAASKNFEYSSDNLGEARRSSSELSQSGGVQHKMGESGRSDKINSQADSLRDGQKSIQSLSKEMGVDSSKDKE